MTSHKMEAEKRINSIGPLIAERNKVRLVWSVAVCVVAGVVVTGCLAMMLYQYDWGHPLALGAVTGTLAAVFILGTYKTQCVFRRREF